MRSIFFLFIALVLLSFGVGGCSTMRKISKAGVRELSSDERSGRESISEVRARIQSSTHFARACPKELSGEIAQLAAERVATPTCPPGFVELVQVSSGMLKLEERSLLEEISGTQCRLLVDSERDLSLQKFLDSFEINGPIGRRKMASDSTASAADDIQTLEHLRTSLDDILSINVPLEHWILRNGGYVLPEADLNFFYALIVQNDCRVDSNTLDDGFRAMQTLEELRRLMPDGATKSSLERFMQGLHKLIDKKVGEYFLTYVGRQ